MRGQPPDLPRLASADPVSSYDVPAFASDANDRVEEIPSPLSYPGGVELFRQGDAPNEVFHLEHGLVKLVRMQSSGTQTIVGLRSAGWFLGSAAVVLGRSHAMTAVTITPSMIARIPAGTFRHLLRSDAALSWRLHRMHSEEIHTDLTRAADDRSLPARERLGRFLRTFATHREGRVPRRADVPLKQWEIADLLGITPQYLSQLLHEMEAEEHTSES
jgi:CRP-like cAMP-binding protein